MRFLYAVRTLCTLIYVVSGVLLYAQNPALSYDASNAFENAQGDDTYTNPSGVMDRNGNVNFITAYFGTYSLAIVKYNRAGDLLNQILLTNIDAIGGSNNGYLLMDKQNNYYVLGEDESTQTLKLEKLNSSGQKIWSYVFGDTGNTTRAPALSMDSQNNIYVEGYYYGISTEFMTKLDKNGNVIWSKTYDHQPLYDFPVFNKLKLDDSGAIYGVGYADKLSDESFNFLTEKYNSDGDLLWSSIFSAAKSSGDNANDVVIAPSGNIYVTGSTVPKHSGNILSMTTIKYDANGNQLWAKTFAGTGSHGGNNAHRIFLDDKENVYIAGESDNGGNTALDLTEIKYDKNGNQKWVATFPFGISGSYNYDVLADASFDNQGNMSLLGLSYDTLQTFTEYHRELFLKINKQGSILFSQLYHSGAQYNEKASSMIVDDSGNIYSLGSGFNPFNNLPSTYLNKRNANDEILYQQNYQAPLSGQEYHKSALLDENGNFFSGNNIVDASAGDHPRNAYQYDTSGNLTLVNAYDAGGMNRVRRDKQNNILICGFNDSYQDPQIIVCDGSGRKKWEAAISVFQNKGVAVDANSDSAGNIYVTGYLKPKKDSTDVFLYKYDSSGNLIWSKTYNGPGKGNDEPYAMSIDKDGNAFICGRTQNGNTYQPLLLKYQDNGSFIWQQILASVSGARDFGYDVVADNRGGCFMTGRYTQSKPGRQGFFVLKTNNGGQVKYLSYRKGHEQNNTDFGTHLLLDASGNIYAEGRVTKGGLPYGISIIKYDKKLNQQWSFEQSGYNFAFDDSIGAVISYNDPLQFALDANGNIYLANVVNISYDVQIYKLDSTGQQQWMYTSAVSETKIHPSPNIISDAKGNLWCVFNIYHNDVTNYDWRILKFNGSSSSPQVFSSSSFTLKNENNMNTSSAMQIRAFPIPASDFLELNGKGFVPGSVEIIIRDELGQLVYHSQQQNELSAFSSQIPLHSLESGIYYLEVNNTNHRSMQRFIKQ